MAQSTGFLLWFQAVCFIASAAVFEYNLPTINQSPGDARSQISTDCYSGNGANYRGSWLLTASGKVCQLWTNSPTINPWSSPGKGLGEHNFCRNPDNDKQPWCWVDDRGREFEYCSLPACSTTREATTATTTQSTAPASANGGAGSPVECYSGDGSDYRGTASVTDKGTSCLMWSESTFINPSSHRNKGLGAHNYCRNPDGDKKPWCWVNHREAQFGYCDIPVCLYTPPPPRTITAQPEQPTPRPDPGSGARPETETNAGVSCYEGDGADYRGSVSVTDGGTACLAWSNSPYINPISHPGKGLGHHTYCRNPDGDTRPWCWVDHRRRKFGYCDIPRCLSTVPTTPTSTDSTPTTTPETTTFRSTEPTVNDCYRGNGETYRGFAQTTDGGLLCKKWTSNSKINPWTHPDAGLGEHNYCRNPDQDKKPWCWVDSRNFGYCQVPECPVAPAPRPTGNSSLTCGRRPLERDVTRLRLRRFVAIPVEEASSKIVGGNIPMYGMYPWQASVRVITTIYSNGRVSAKHNCGGTIIGEYWILSAAHCYVGVPDSRLIVYVGEHNLYNKESSEQRFQVERVIENSQYSKITHDYDIALLKLKSENGRGIQFDDFVQPACLPEENTPYTERKMCLISGWGRTETTSPTLMRAAEVPLVSDRMCRRLHSGISTRMFCAGHIEGGVDTCSGDSGGPLVCEMQGYYTVMGVTSWGVDCGAAGSPGVYTKVSELLPWIQNVMSSYS